MVEERWVLILVHVALWWLVQVLACQLSSSCLSLVKSFLLTLLFRLFGSLDLFEFFKDILVVKESVRELILEDILLEEFLYSILDAGHLEQLMNIWSLSWISLQHERQDVGHILREVRWQRSVLSLNDSLSELMERLCVEGRLQGSHLV